MSWLTVQDLVKIYKGEKIIDQLSFSVAQGTKLGIAGETGAAKTTLLKIIAGLLQADHGQVFVDGTKVIGPDDQLLPGHPSTSYVSQHFELRNNYRVEEELEMASNLSVKELSRISSICRVDHLLKRKTNELSGGERQRIVLARALVKKPKLLLLDEPFSNLDPAHKNSMKEVLNELASQFSLTMILVSHDGSDLLSWADNLLLLRKGKIEQSGNPIALYQTPVSAYTAGLLGPFNLIQESDPPSVIKLFKKYSPIKFPLIIRPEQLKLLNQESYQEGIQGTIEASLFMGGYWLVQVLVMGKKICVQSLSQPLSPGALVSVLAV